MCIFLNIFLRRNPKKTQRLQQEAVGCGIGSEVLLGHSCDWRDAAGSEEGARLIGDGRDMRVCRKPQREALFQWKLNTALTHYAEYILTGLRLPTYLHSTSHKQGTVGEISLSLFIHSARHARAEIFHLFSVGSSPVLFLKKLSKAAVISAASVAGIWHLHI